MLKLKRSCEQIKCQASRRQLNWHWPEKHCPETCRVSQHRLQMACIKLISHTHTAPLFLHTGHNRQTHMGNSIPAPWGVGQIETEIICPSSPQQPQALENVIGVAERTTIQGTLDSRVMSAEIVEKRDTYKPCAEAEVLHNT